ncbi:MAG TPA: hypothetical protein VFQ53_26490 [Kofleriaceae bacterium]|nr:hypothetical protein [Kofleriaceae bacterium]
MSLSNGLYGLAQTGLARDPLSGELFLFVNQSRKLCKVLLGRRRAVHFPEAAREGHVRQTGGATTVRSCG